jgi:aerobic carbon-monoxide dehydrogenase medium subunit
MKPSSFEYHAPRTVDECVALLVEYEEDEPKLLAGGQSLVPLMNLRMARPEVLVDLNRIADLAYVREDGDTLALGAMTRYADVETSPLVQQLCPLLARATREVGYTAIRNRGTVGGSVAHADPVAEWPCLVRTLDAELVATGPAGRRTMPAAEFFAGLFTTALAPTEVLTEIRVPLRRGPGGWSFEEFARKTGDYAVVAVAIDLATADGVVEQAKVGFANLSDRPVRSPAIEALLAGLPLAEGPPPPALLEALAGALREEQATDAYRINLAGVLAGRALTQALAGADGGPR